MQRFLPVFVLREPRSVASCMFFCQEKQDATLLVYFYAKKTKKRCILYVFLQKEARCNASNDFQHKKKIKSKSFHYIRPR